MNRALSEWYSTRTRDDDNVTTSAYVHENQVALPSNRRSTEILRAVFLGRIASSGYFSGTSVPPASLGVPPPLDFGRFSVNDRFSTSNKIPSYAPKDRAVVVSSSVRNITTPGRLGTSATAYYA